MEEIVYLDGSIYKLKEAEVNIFKGNEVFNGVFESLIVVNGKIFRLEEHLKRLFNSAKVLQIALPSQIKETILFTVKKSNLQNIYLRVSIVQREKKNSLIILVKKASIYPKEFFTKGVSISFVSTQRNYDEALTPKVKCSNFLANVLAKNEIVSRNSFEIVSLNSKGLITEGTISNIFLVSEETVYTPKISLGILEGVTRNIAINICKNLNIKVKEECLTRYDAYTADEIFLTFTSAGILPATKVDSKLVGSGKVGKISKIIHKEYRKKLR
ncbi:MAG: aminotransferase class IV [bacterium]|nr:aminotransferase class IV [bacterium]